MKWKHLFDYNILDRGMDYFEDDRVTVKEISENQILADVEGSEDYNIRIRLENGEIAAMSCDCPYATGGAKCKHMAAVLYAAARKYKTLPQSTEDAEALPEAIAALPREMIETLLLELAENNHKLRERIILIATKKLPRNYRSVWQEEISAILELDSFYETGDYDEIYEHFCNLTAHLEESADSLIKSGLLWEAFELVSMAYQSVTNAEEYDWDNILDEMTDLCNSLWTKLYEEANIELRRRMFRGLWQMSMDTDQFMESDTADALVNIFEEPEFAQELLAEVDAVLQKAKGENTDYHINQRMTLMKHLGASLREQIDFLQSYFNRPHARQLQIDLLIAEGLNHEAISLLNASKDMDAENKYLVSGYCRKLILLYQRTEQIQELREELTHYVLCYEQKDLDYIRQLKKATPPEEWGELSLKIQLSKSTQGILDQFLAAEGMWQNLMQKIAVSESTFLLEKHEEELGSHFPEQVRDFWLARAQQFILHANDRGAYRYAANLLKKAMTYSGGKEKAFTIACQWKTTYYRRTALKEELGKIGL